MSRKSEQDPESDVRIGPGEKLTSNDLAGLIVDALFHPGIVKAEDIERAITIATEEIDARKAMGDY